jgi:iron-sulfur cluster assembly protein
MSTPIRLTPRAVAHIKKILQNNSDAIGVRVGVKSSGCSGLSYVLDFASNPQASDEIHEIDGIQVLIDSNSIEYLKGTEIDCSTEGLNDYIKFNNPNVKGECGCGESFSIKEA